MMIHNIPHNLKVENSDGFMSWFKNQCKCRLCDKTSINSYFLQQIIRLGPTILGVKPAHILNIRNLSEWNDCKECLLKHSKIKIREISIYGKSSKVFFYHIDALNETLSEKPNLKFLQKIGYPKKYSVEVYVDHLINKMGSEDFPHEIGIFLGYPLKDVVGFMVYKDINPSKIKGWRFYGDVKVSEKTYRSFINARESVKSLVFSYLHKDLRRSS